MTLQEFDYRLPESLIAQQPARPRDAARLLVLDRKTGRCDHRRFFDCADYFSAGDVLVVNDSRVIPARLRGRKVSGGEIELLLSKRSDTSTKDREAWECLARGKKLQAGLEITLSRGITATMILKKAEVWLVAFSCGRKEFELFLQRHGSMPLPPYIASSGGADKRDYQTVYADKTHKGSVAAPTAGLHFTPRLLKKLKAKGVIIEKVTLHVGLGTFMPIREVDPKKHVMHAEWVEVSARVKKTINQARKTNHKVIAVGTTTVRSLEAAFAESPSKPFAGWVDIFIYPPYKFKAIDGMITNFHVPKSTLLMLVSAFAGRDHIMAAYEEAIKKKYRFFSYGDAMLIK